LVVSLDLPYILLRDELLSCDVSGLNEFLQDLVILALQYLVLHVGLQGARQFNVL
jgi:hypothetical protein